MNQNDSNHPGIHYHIRWSMGGAATLDLEPFKTLDKAHRQAMELVRQNDTYTAEEFDESCPACRAMPAPSGSRLAL